MNFPESTTILNAHTKSGNLSYAPCSNYQASFKKFRQITIKC